MYFLPLFFNVVKYINLLFRQLKIRRVDNFNAAALMLMKSLPLIADDLAQDAEYHQLHPYTLKSREQFLSLPFGKQRAIEVSFFFKALISKNHFHVNFM